METIERNNLRKRFIMFLLGCIVIRTLFVIVAKNASLETLPYLGYFALMPVIGWFYIVFIKSRDTGPEVFGDKIWWNKLRPFHMFWYSAFAYMAINKNPDAWIMLAADVVMGLSSFLIHHYSEGNFSKVL